jgi:uncharacterized protein YjbJ (UPF0337 family)
MNTLGCRNLEGAWHILVGRFKQKYGRFQRCVRKIKEGKAEELQGQLERRTTMSREEIRKFITKLS